MAFPSGWPGRYPSGIRSLRFYVTDTATANFSDKAYLFASGAGAMPYTPMPRIAPGSTEVVNIGTKTTGASPYAGTNLDTPGPDNTLSTLTGWSHGIRICNDDGAAIALEYSFDGTNVHGKLLAGEKVVYYPRHEAGISVRGAGAVFRIEAW